ncbi:MAG: hypothetical protein IJU86_02530 [Firmicutes bacterium]|nr:hypothetical protein [Bacillota bacterium]
MIRNVDEKQNSLVNDSELHEKIILESNENLNLGRNDFVDQEEVENLFVIFVCDFCKNGWNLAKYCKRVHKFV